MSQVYNKLKIDIKEPITDIITAKQNDSESRFLDVYLYDSGVAINLTGHEVRIYMRKPDGREVFNNGEITDATSGRCQFELTDQALGAVGYLKCEISIWKDNTQILTTQTFNVFVIESLRTSGSVESSNEYGALVVLYQNLYEAIDLMTTMVEQFGEPGDVSAAASIATFWQMLEYLYNVNKDALASSSVQGVIDLIGATGNTGGSANAGTVMAKLNAVIGYLVNSTYGLSALKALIDKILNCTVKFYNPSSSVLQNFDFVTGAQNFDKTHTYSGNTYRDLKKKVTSNFIPKADGIVICTFQLVITKKANVRYQSDIGDFVLVNAINLDNDTRRINVSGGTNYPNRAFKKALDAKNTVYAYGNEGYDGCQCFYSEIGFNYEENIPTTAVSKTINLEMPMYVRKGAPLYVLFDFSASIQNASDYTVELKSAVIKTALSSLY